MVVWWCGVWGVEPCAHPLLHTVVSCGVWGGLLQAACGHVVPGCGQRRSCVAVNRRGNAELCPVPLLYRCQVGDLLREHDRIQMLYTPTASYR